MRTEDNRRSPLLARGWAMARAFLSVAAVEFVRDQHEQEIHVAEDGTVLKRKAD